MTAERGEFEGGAAGFIRLMKERGGREKFREQRGFAEARGLVQRQAFGVVAGVEPRARVQEGRHGCLVAAGRGEVQRRAPAVIGKLWIETEREKFPDERRGIIPRGEMQERAAGEAGALDVGLTLEQPRGDFVAVFEEREFEQAHGQRVVAQPGRDLRGHFLEQRELSALDHGEEQRVVVGRFCGRVRAVFEEQRGHCVEALRISPVQRRAALGIADAGEFTGIFLQPCVHAGKILEPDAREEVGLLAGAEEIPIGGRLDARAVEVGRTGRAVKDHGLQGRQRGGSVGGRGGRLRRRERKGEQGVPALVVTGEVEERTAVGIADRVRARVGEHEVEPVFAAGDGDHLERGVGEIGFAIARENIGTVQAEQSDRLDARGERGRWLREERVDPKAGGRTARSIRRGCGAGVFDAGAESAGPHGESERGVAGVAWCVNRAARREQTLDDARAAFRGGEMQRSLAGNKGAGIDGHAGLEQRGHDIFVAQFRGDVQPASTTRITVERERGLGGEQLFRTVGIAVAHGCGPLGVRGIFGARGERCWCERQRCQGRHVVWQTKEKSWREHCWQARCQRSDQNRRRADGQCRDGRRRANFLRGGGRDGVDGEQNRQHGDDWKIGTQVCHG